MLRIKQEKVYRKEVAQSEKLLQFKKNEFAMSGENDTKVDYWTDIQLDGKIIMVKEQDKLKQQQDTATEV
jgi:RNase P/RNase MRP subunit p29